MSAVPDDNPLWRFSLAVYGATGVAEECIGLQDRNGLDVNVLLFVAWLGAERALLLSPRHVEAIEAAGSNWQQDVLTHVRTARRNLKHAGHPSLYEEIKSLELKIERAEQAQLLLLVSALDGPTAAPSDALRANVALYTEKKGAPLPAALIAAAGALLQRSR